MPQLLRGNDPSEETTAEASVTEGSPGDTIIVTGSCPTWFRADVVTVGLNELANEASSFFVSAEGPVVDDLFRVELTIPLDAPVTNPYRLGVSCETGDASSGGPSFEFAMLPVSAPPTTTRDLSSPTASAIAAPVTSAPLSGNGTSATGVAITGALTGVLLVASASLILRRARRRRDIGV